MPTRSWIALAALATVACLGACTKDSPPPPPVEDPAIAIAIAEALPVAKPPAAPGPQLLVTVDLAGASVLAVDTELLDPIERAITEADAIASTPAIATMEGIATPGRARVYVSLRSGSDPLAVSAALRLAIERAGPASGLASDMAEVVSPVTIERADRNGALLFAVVEPENPDRPPSLEPDPAFARLADRVAQQPGVWKVKRCGERRRVLVFELDMRRMQAYGLAVDTLAQWIEAQVPAGLRALGLDGAMRTLSSPVAGSIRLTDLAALRDETTRGACTVTNATGGTAPTLEIWGTPAGIAAASAVLRSDAAAPRVQLWTPGNRETPTAVVSSLLSPDELRGEQLRWLASERGAPAWLLQDGDDPAWLLAGEDTSLLSFSLATMHEMHIWWPGAPPPVTARICGAPHDALAETASTLAGRMSDDELLDDVAVWIAAMRPRKSFELDRTIAAARGVEPRAVARVARLLSSNELRIGHDIVLRIADRDAPLLSVSSTAGAVPLRDLGTVRDVLEPAFVLHVDRRRCVLVDLQPRRTEDRARIESLVAERAQPLPSDVVVTIAPQ